MNLNDILQIIAAVIYAAIAAAYLLPGHGLRVRLVLAGLHLLLAALTVAKALMHI